MTKNSKPNKSKFIGISGPPGAGKDYLSKFIVSNLKLNRVAMVTTRPARPEEEKICINDKEYNKLLKNNLLVGHHINKGYKYAYKIYDLKAIKGPGIIELNPINQVSLKDELSKHGINFAGWVGIVGDIEYLISNMNSRQKMPDTEITKRTDMARSIVQEIKKLHDNNIINVIFKVGWHNRKSMTTEFANIIKTYLNKD